MGWFNRKPRDLIADSNAEWETQRNLEALESVVIRNRINPEPDAHLSQPLIAAGGWCAPSEPGYGFLDLPEIQIKRGGIKWPMT
jgi:hypothetical protein